MKRRFRSNRKGISTVISTIIIVAISITMAIAIAFWAMGIGNSMTKFEKLEFVSIYADTPTTRATATATISSSQVLSINVVYGGSGYLTAPAVSITGGNGLGATATATLSNNVVNSIFVTNPGTGYTSVPTVNIAAPTGTGNGYPVYIQLKNTGSAAATINNFFIDGKPFNVAGVTNQNIVPSSTNNPIVIQVGQRTNTLSFYLPVGSTWNSGDYVEIEIQTSAGRLYSNTVVIP